MRVAKTVSLSLSAALLVGMMGLTGCNHDARVGTKNVKNTAHRLNVNAYDQRGRGTNDLKDLKYDSALTKKVTEIGAVRTAHVMTTGNEAFVAVTLNGTNPSGAAVPDMYPNAAGMGSMNRVAPNAVGTGNVTGHTSSLGRSMGQGVNPGGSDYRPNGAIGGVGTIDTANPGTTYDGTRLGGGLGVNATNTPGSMTTRGTSADVPADVKREIESKVKTSAPHIKQVYISSDKNFVDRVGTYSNNTDGTNLGADLTNGVRDAGRDLYDMIESIFPMRRGNLAPAPAPAPAPARNTNPVNGTDTNPLVNPAR